MGDQKGFDLTQRQTFRRFTPVTMRFSDTDKLGHVNNVAIASYFEAARCELFDAVLKQAKLGPDIDYVLARIAIDFKRELHYPGAVEVGGRFVRVGNSAIVTGYGAFFNGACFATGEAVNVFFNLKTRTSIAPPPVLRTLLESEIAA